METPRLLAIEDVTLAASPELAMPVAEFYTSVVGLHLVEPRPEDPSLVFCGYSPVKPRLVVKLTQEERRKLRGIVQVQVASLDPIRQMLDERKLAATWMQNLSFFDRRLMIPDPAGNRVELLTYHIL